MSGPWHWRFVLAHWIMSVMPRHRANIVRAMLYRWAGLAIGPSSIVYGNLRLWGGPDPIAALRIGRLCRINTPCSINLDAPVTLGDRVVLGHGVTIITASHRMNNPACRAGAMYAQPVTIEDGAWIAANATLLPGVTIGAGAVVGAGSVVTHDVPAHTLVVGNPARVVRTLNQSPALDQIDAVLRCAPATAPI